MRSEKQMVFNMKFDSICMRKIFAMYLAKLKPTDGCLHNE